MNVFMPPSSEIILYNTFLPSHIPPPLPPTSPHSSTIHGNGSPHIKICVREFIYLIEGIHPSVRKHIRVHSLFLFEEASPSQFMVHRCL